MLLIRPSQLDLDIVAWCVVSAKSETIISDWRNRSSRILCVMFVPPTGRCERRSPCGKKSGLPRPELPEFVPKTSCSDRKQDRQNKAEAAGEDTPTGTKDSQAKQVSEQEGLKPATPIKGTKGKLHPSEQTGKEETKSSTDVWMCKHCCAIFRMKSR